MYDAISRDVVCLLADSLHNGGLAAYDKYLSGARSSGVATYAEFFLGLGAARIFSTGSLDGVSGMAGLVDVGSLDAGGGNRVQSGNGGGSSIVDAGDIPCDFQRVNSPIGVDVNGFCNRSVDECTGSSGMNGCVRGPNYARNKASREKKKEKKKKTENSHASFFSSCDKEVRDRLCASRAARYIAENEREAAKALKESQLIAISDVQDEARRRRAKVVADTERCLVSIEKTHATLVAAGDVPGEGQGFAATVVGSTSISANSSVSNAEYRKCQKDLLDASQKVVLMREALEKAGLDVPHSPRSLRSMNHANGIWTDNTENRAYFDETYSCYGQQDMEIFGHPGKIRVIPC